MTSATNRPSSNLRMTMALFVSLFALGCSSNASRDVSNRQEAAAQLEPPPRKDFANPDEAAQQALITLRSLVAASQNPGDFGLNAIGELDSAGLGKPAELFYVKADELSRFKPGNDETQLLHKSNKLVYPVVINGEGRLLITLKQDGDKWTAVAWGQESLAHNLTQVTKSKASSGPGSPAQPTMAVEIPSMHVTFLAQPRPSNAPGGKKRFNFASLNDFSELQHNKLLQGVASFQNPEFSAEGKATQNASTVFSSLAPSAKKVMENKDKGPGM